MNDRALLGVRFVFGMENRVEERVFRHALVFPGNIGSGEEVWAFRAQNYIPRPHFMPIEASHGYGGPPRAGKSSV